MSLIDSHIHLDFPAFDPDRTAVVARANAVGVTGFVVPSVTEARWSCVARTAREVPGGLAAYGMHPCYLEHHAEDACSHLAHWLGEHSAVAIGECGLDFHVNPVESQARQYALFDGQISLAVQLGLPLIVHARKAVDQVTQRLKLGGATLGVVHSFSGSWQQACKLIDAGFVIGVGGNITHDRAQKLRKIAARLPHDAWVVETDAPDQPGAKHRGERNEPAYLIEVVERLALLRGVGDESIRVQAFENTQRLFFLEN